MADSTKFIIFVFFCFGSIVGFIGFQQWKLSKKSAERSCLASIAAATINAQRSGQIQLNEKSRELTKDEIDALIKQGKIGDCGRKEYMFENLHIAIGEVNKKSDLQIRVWTNGDDKISGTIDDVIYPWEESAEQI